MTTPPRLTVTEPSGRRTVPIDPVPFGIGRRTSAHLQVISRDVSREHAEIVLEGEAYLIRDLGSRFGTYVNDEAVEAPRALVHGDRIRLGQSEEIELVFQADNVLSTSISSLRSGFPDLQQMAAVLNGLRALGSGRVLDEVLTLVLESALEVTTAERGFIMLANAAGALEMKVACGRNQQVLPEDTFATSVKIPREVFETGKSRMVADLLDMDLKGAHDRTVAAGIRHVLCVPLTVLPIGTGSQGDGSIRTIGVLYLDGRERGTLLSSQTRSSLDAFATQAALAIDSARLYAEAAEKARLERDLRVAAEIQQALLPPPRFETAAVDLAAASIACRTIGGDFFDYLQLPDGSLGVTLGDVSGKGPPAALLAAAVQSNFAALAPVLRDPAETTASINQALLRRAIEARFATMFFGVLEPGGRFSYCNAGQEPPLLVRAGGEIVLLEAGGPPVGILEISRYETATVELRPGDLVIIYSDGVTEASNASGDEFGRDRIAQFAQGRHGEAAAHLLDQLIALVREFAGEAPQADDLTAMVLHYSGA